MFPDSKGEIDSNRIIVEIKYLIYQWIDYPEEQLQEAQALNDILDQTNFTVLQKSVPS